MEEFKGSIGPWRVGENNGVSKMCVFSGKTLILQGSEFYVPDQTKREANARLAASAYDLLHACQNSLLQLELQMMGDSGTANILRKAITKALGK